MLYEEGILSVVLRTVISCGRDKYGAVEKTLKGIFTICTLLGFPVVVALWWTIYIGVKRFRYSGSVVPAMPSASAICVFIRNETHGDRSAKSCCQVARSCFKGILRAHRHSLFSFTIQMLVQSDLLKYWFAETARYQNGQGSTASGAFVNFLNIDRGGAIAGDVFLSIPRRASQDLSALEQQCGLRLIRLYARVSPCSKHTVRSNSVVWEMVWHNVESPFKGNVCCW